MRKVTLVIIVLILTLVLWGQTKITPLPDLKKPGSFYMDDTRMYVVEEVSVYIYSLKDLKLVKKFGKYGEGPREMMLNPQYGPMILDVRGDEILVHSFSKLSRFTKNGVYKSETRLPNPLIFRIQKFGKYLIASRLIQENNTTMRALNVYDDHMNKVGQIVRVPHVFTSGKGWKVLKSNPITVVHKDKLIYGWENALKLNVMDTGFKILYTITHEVDRIKVTDKDRKIIIDYIKKNPRTKDIYEQLKPIRFPVYFPAMIDVFPDVDKLYIYTFNKKEMDDVNEYEFLVFDIKGKYLDSIFLPLRMMNPLRSYPITIHKGYLYQLVEDIEKEQWSLQEIKIELST
jgi:hypothetical protein